MESRFALFALFSLLLIAGISDARHDPAGEYWQSIMKDEAMPEAIQGLIDDIRESVLPRTSTSTGHAHHNHKLVEENAKEKHFEPRPNLSAYDDEKLTDFEPMPTTASAYHDDASDKSFVNDFEPRPDASNYHE